MTYMDPHAHPNHAIIICNLGYIVVVARRKSDCVWSQYTFTMLAPRHARVHLVQTYAQSLQYPVQILSIHVHRFRCACHT